VGKYRSVLEILKRYLAREANFLLSPCLFKEKSDGPSGTLEVGGPKHFLTSAAGEWGGQFLLPLDHLWTEGHIHPFP